MSLEELARQGQEMRAAQKDYFRSVRNGVSPDMLHGMMVKAKSLERMFDLAAAEVLTPPKPNLFTEASK